MTKKYILRSFLLSPLVLLCFLSCSLREQRHLGALHYRGSDAYKKYVAAYAPMSIQQMRSYGIPASITMAQALLESSAGRSYLARKGNNHFGIKCHRSWRGGRVYRDDDRRNECFRKYARVSDSYEDHSRFLQRSRYRFLYRYGKKDYRRWARGLKRAGYATDPSYSRKLIELIEKYELDALDRGQMPSYLVGQGLVASSSSKPTRVEGEIEDDIYGLSSHLIKRRPRQQFQLNDLLCVQAEEGDTFSTIAQDMGLSAQDVADYNEAPIDFVLHERDLVYLERKNRILLLGPRDYVVERGDTMYSIAQKFGLRLRSLYQLNGLDMDSYELSIGDVLRLR